MIRSSTGAAGTTPGTVSAIALTKDATIVAPVGGRLETVETHIAGASTGAPTIV